MFSQVSYYATRSSRPIVPITFSSITPAFFLEYVLVNPTVSNTLFASLTPASLIRFASTCRGARRAVNAYLRLAYDINRHLSRFFPDPRVFRTLQAHTGTLVSGSNVLQFLDRTFYPSSDLDIYVEGRHAWQIGCWLLDIGYEYVPNLKEFPTFEDMFAARLSMEDPSPTTVTILEQSNPGWYWMRGVGCVYNFIKCAPDGSVGLKVQLISASLTPMEIILQFHSTCVMNIISYEKAYSLFPRATFEERRSLIVATAGPRQEMAREKYAERGWDMLPNLTQEEQADPHSSFHLGFRWLGDRFTWTMPLDLEGVDVPPNVGSTSLSRPQDNLSAHSWVVKHPENAEIDFTILSSPALKYNYTTHNSKLPKWAEHTLQRAEQVNAWRVANLGLDKSFVDTEFNNACKSSNYFRSRVDEFTEHIDITSRQ